MGDFLLTVSEIPVFGPGGRNQLQTRKERRIIRAFPDARFHLLGVEAEAPEVQRLSHLAPRAGGLSAPSSPPALPCAWSSANVPLMVLMVPPAVCEVVQAPLFKPADGGSY